VRAALRALAARQGVAELHRQLAALDPEAAARIHPRDAVRLERALEVVFGSGRRLSDWQAAHRFGEAPYDALVIGLAVAPRELDARIAARAAGMLESGFADEVRGLLARGLPETAPAWATVGYRAVRAFVEGACDGDAALAAVVHATRRYAKRQRTWWRAEPGIVWRAPATERDRVRREVAAFLARGERPEHAAEAAPLPARVAKPMGPR
jgi:tRNA dimethylallyltransferase